jgi:hypothetical protein
MRGSAPLGNVEGVGLDIATTRGTLVDPGGTAHTDSAWIELIAATSFPYQWLNLALGKGAAVSGALSDHLIDIGVGASGSEKILIPDILAHNDSAGDTPPTTYSFPISIPSGTRISARMRGSITGAGSRTLDIAMWGVG